MGASPVPSREEGARVLGWAWGPEALPNRFERACSTSWGVLFGWVWWVGPQAAWTGTGVMKAAVCPPGTLLCSQHGGMLHTGLPTCIDMSAQLCCQLKPFLRIGAGAPRWRSSGCPGLQSMRSGAVLTWAESWGADPYSWAALCGSQGWEACAGILRQAEAFVR